MALKNKTLFWVLLALVGSVLLFNLITLSVYPIPWFDETYFASISNDFLLHGSFYPLVAPGAVHYQNCYGYGPIYFILTAFCIKLFGFGSFASRFVGFACWLTMGYYFIKIFLLNKTNAGWLAWLLLISFFFDYTLVDNAHLGRMETLAATFVFGYTYYILKNEFVNANRRRYINALVYSLFAVIAVLSTPRSGILLVPPGLIVLYNFLKQRKNKYFIELVIIAVVFGSLYFAWIYYAFGSPVKMFQFYKDVNQSKDMVVPFSFKQSIFIYQYPVILVALFVSAVALIMAGASFFDLISVISLLTIVLFYLFVSVHQAYTTYVMPYFYLLIFHSLYKIKQAQPKKYLLSLSNLCVYGLLLLMIFLTTLKGYYIFNSIKERNPEAINAFIKANIPAGSRVTGDEMYYFAVLKAGSDFEYLDRFNSYEVREKYEREQYNYDYIIVSNSWLNFAPQCFNVFKAHATLIPIARFNPPLSKITTYISKSRPGLTPFTSYNGYIYKRVKN